VEGDIALHLLAFEIKFQGVKFEGFDRILVICLSSKGGIEFDRILTWINCRSEWRIILVLSPGDDHFHNTALKGGSFDAAFLVYQDLKNILLAESPGTAFLDAILDQIHLSSLSPLQFAGPVNAMSNMFYGREAERKTIVSSMFSQSSRSHAVIGPRRIGKTSLLFRVKEEIAQRKHYRAVFMDLGSYPKADQPWYKAALSALGVQQHIASLPDFVSAVRGYCANSGSKVAFFLDEVDDLLQAEEHNEYEFSKALRAIINEANVKVVIAGYAQLYFEMCNMRSPMFNIFQPVELSSLDERDACALIEESFRNIFHVTRADIQYILEKTTCYPIFIQFFCNELVRLADKERTRHITRDLIDQVASSPKLNEYMIDVYKGNLDDQCKLLLYLMADHYDPRLGRIIIQPESRERALKSGYAQAELKFEIGATFTTNDVHRLLVRYKADLTADQVEPVVKKLTLASIFKREEATREYSFLLAELPALLKRQGNADNEVLLLLGRIDKLFSVNV
jgi:hypothetical protein